MKEQTAKFKCDADGCSKSATMDGSEFPYKEGWVYLYNLNFKTTPSIVSQQKDKHFCSTKCALNFISKKISGVVQ